MAFQQQAYVPEAFSGGIPNVSTQPNSLDTELFSEVLKVRVRRGKTEKGRQFLPFCSSALCVALASA